MTKKAYTPGTFIELDDLYGNRKVSMVAKDGVTFWDQFDTQSITPLAIHPVFKPLEIGTLMEFVQVNKLEDALKSVTTYFQRKLDDTIQNDPIYLMRIMWSIATQAKNSGETFVLSDDVINQAIAYAQDQAKKALLVHGFSARFNS